MSHTSRGTNVFEDLARDAEHLAAAVRVNANQPITVIGHALLTAAFDDTLDSLGRVCSARPGVGDRYDVELPSMYRPPAPRGTGVIWVDDDMLDDVARDGFFDQFDEPARVRKCAGHPRPAHLRNRTRRRELYVGAVRTSRSSS